MQEILQRGGDQGEVEGHTNYFQEDRVSIQSEANQATMCFLHLNLARVLLYDKHIGQGFMAGTLCASYRDAKWYLVCLDDMQRGTEQRCGIQ